MKNRRKKLIELSLPLDSINLACQQEKNPFLKNHPRNLHLWWARRPLAACRAVLFAQLVDDPSSDPEYRRPDGSVDEERAGIKRAELFNLIEELVKWENSNNPVVINKARAEIARCVASRKIELGELKKDTIIYGRDEGSGHPDGPLPQDGRYTAWQVSCRLAPPKVVSHFLEKYAPPVLDPFAGGGSIPLEAQRLGLRAHASDLNPVAVLICKALIEIPPKFAGLPPVNPESTKRTVWQGAQGLAEDVRYYGKWIRDEAEKRIGHLYPKVKITQEMVDDGRPDLKPYLGQELTVIAWLWARTVKCPNPACGNRFPMLRSFWLSKKKGKEVHVQPIINQGKVRFRPVLGKDNVPKHTTDRTGARCIFCGQFIKKPELRDLARKYGVNEVPLAIVAEGNHGRIYLPFSENDIPTLEKPDVPALQQPLVDDKRWFSPPLYGLPEFADLFTPRQLTALTTFSDLVKEAHKKVLKDAEKAGTLPNDGHSLDEGGSDPQAYADSIATYLAFGISQLSRYSSTLCSWNQTNQNIAQMFGRQALPMVWDFAEANTIVGVLSIASTIEWIANSLRNIPYYPKGLSFQHNATNKLVLDNPPIIATDPPYYDNIGYADLSDFFYIWLRRSLRAVYPGLLATMLTPKAEELIASPYRHGGDRKKAAEFFETGLGQAIRQWRQYIHPNYPTTIFYAFKQAETNKSGTASTGWETFLTGIIEAGFNITATLPIRTERTKGLKGGVNALASSVVLACVPRAEDASLATRREFIAALKRELTDALRLLQSGSIAPVDLAQAAIGPGMAIFSRYARVVESDGSSMTVRTALTLINQVLDEVLSAQEGEFDADTRWAVAWFEQHGMDEGEFGVAETLSKAKNTAVNGLVDAGLITARSGKVRLIPRDQMPEDWDPAADKRLTGWEATQYLIRALDRKGEPGAADLLRKLGGDYGERARDLAYRLYAICERKGWSGEALAYNSLVIAWPEISKLRSQESGVRRQEQGEMFE